MVGKKDKLGGRPFSTAPSKKQQKRQRTLVLLRLRSITIITVYHIERAKLKNIFVLKDKSYSIRLKDQNRKILVSEDHNVRLERVKILKYLSRRTKNNNHISLGRPEMINFTP